MVPFWQASVQSHLVESYEISMNDNQDNIKKEGLVESLEIKEESFQCSQCGQKIDNERLHDDMKQSCFQCQSRSDCL